MRMPRVLVLTHKNLRFELTAKTALPGRRWRVQFIWNPSPLNNWTRTGARTIVTIETSQTAGEGFSLVDIPLHDANSSVPVAR
jgi:hypothetical protein